MPKALSRFFQFLKIKIGQRYLTELKLSTKANNVQEETHVRVKRKMTKFVRDRKQMTRKKKIGRRKKTKVRSAPIKLLKWYDKHFKKKKKGDGTYRGGRGRIPRQHKRPRHYKPPQNETSDYDYYDEEGNVRVASGETQEGSDDADYVSYVSGEYKDTEEAEAAQQQLEKEYQEQLVRNRKKEARRKMENGTLESSEEDWSRYLYVPEEKTNNTNNTAVEDEKDKEETVEPKKSEDKSGGESSEGDENNRKRKTRKNTRESKQKNKNKPADNKQSPNRKSNTNISPHKEVKAQNKETKQDSMSARSIARKFKASSFSAFPGIRGSIQIQNEQPPRNKMTAYKYGTPSNDVLQSIQSMPQKKIPDVASLTQAQLISAGGEPLKQLQSKKMFNPVKSATGDKNLKLTSTARDKSQNPLVFNSKTKDEQQHIHSTKNDKMKGLQSLAIDPLILTSIAKHIPELQTAVKTNKSDNKEKVQVNKSKSNLKLKATDNEPPEHGFINNKFNVDNSENFEEMSSVPDDVGRTVGSDEIQSASDDR